MPENDIKHNGLKLKKNYYESQVEDNIVENQAESESSSASQPTSFFHKRDSSRRLWQNIRLAGGWLFFIVLGGGLIYIRFFSGLPGVAPDLLKQYGMIAVGIMYLVSIFFAIKDNMFDGLIAIVVPFYPFYYLFFICGSIFLRAFTAVLLVAFGFDCLVLLQSIALKLMDRVSSWIQHV
ncbi:MAG: hypothetical protein Q7J98_05345 [Kiritimatiellia bacterium]|nr:hypothetical protein [Kiritimatiellia bacterium]